MAIIHACLTCGKKFKILPSDLKYDRGKYCSYRCAGIHNIKNLGEYVNNNPNQFGEDNPNWKGGKITVTCEKCCKKFQARKSAHRKYCSIKCAGSVNAPRNVKILKGKDNPMYGKHLSEAAKRRISEANTGSHHPGINKKYDITKTELGRLYLKEKLSMNQIAEKYGVDHTLILYWMKKYGIPRRTSGEGMKLIWKDVKYVKRMIKKQKEIKIVQNIIKNSHIRPNKLEQKLIDIIKKYNLPYRYTGDCKFWVENINPDFVECDGKKIVIEVFGNYWHSPLLNPKIGRNRTFEGRQKIYRKHGWSCIIIWEDELLQLSEEKILMKLQV